MGAILPHDGAEQFYQIEALYDGNVKTVENEKWLTGLCLSWMEERSPASYGFHKSVSFSASGDVWQKTEHHGTYSRAWANTVLRMVRRTFPQHKFRIVRREITQRTVICVEDKECYAEEFKDEAA